MADLLQLVECDQLLPHAYADNTQFCELCVPSEVNALQERISICFDNVSEWMMAHRLQLNPLKTEVMWCSSARRQHRVPLEPVSIGNTSVLTVSGVCYLGVHFGCNIINSCHTLSVLPYYDKYVVCVCH